MFRIFSIFFLVAMAFVQSGCNKLSAGSEIRQWVNEVLTPKESTLEAVAAGYSIKGNIQNKPRNLVVLYEVSPGGLQFLDSVRTDSKGNFSIDGSVKEPLICQLRWGENDILFLVIDNNTQAKLEISGTGTDISYALMGKGIEASSEMKQLLDLNLKYVLKLQNIQETASKLPSTPEGYAASMKLQTEYYALMAERNKAIRDLMFSLKKSPVPYFVLVTSMLEEMDLPLLEHCMNSLKAYTPAGKYTTDMSKRYEQEKKLAFGAVAPDIKLKQPSGEELSLSSLRGKYVLIDFWASWCGPCRRENPYNRQIYARFKNKGFEIFGVSLDQEAGRWKDAIQRDSLTWYHVSDLGGWGSAPAKLYKVSSIPATYLLDKEGKIVAKGLRGEQLMAKLEELLGP